MDAKLESDVAGEMRSLARQYSEGRFNKQEYRNRRRMLIERCTDETQRLPPALDADHGRKLPVPVMLAMLSMVSAGVAALLYLLF